MSVLTRSGETPQVSPNDFGDHDDRPVGLVLNRFAEQRFGEKVAEPLTLAQLNLARSFESRAARVFGSPHLLDLSDSGSHPAMHLAVAGRYLPLKVDTSFGRYGHVAAQDLIPSGVWTYRLDADLLRLWLEEEAEEITSLWAQELAASSPDVQPARKAASRPLAAAAERSIAKRIPAPIRQAVAPERRKLRVAMLQAAKGDTGALSSLLNGEQVRRVLDKLAAVAPRPHADQPAPSPRGLDHAVLRSLVPELPSLGIDASTLDFDFGQTAEDLIAAVRTTARRELRARPETSRPPTDAELARNPGLLASLAEAQARNTAARVARLFAPSTVELAQAESRRLREAGLPVLAEVASRDTLAGGKLSRPLSGRLRALGIGFGPAGTTTISALRQGSLRGAPRTAEDSFAGATAGASFAGPTLSALGDALVTGLSLKGDNVGLEAAFGHTLNRARREFETPFGSAALQGLGLAWRAQQGGQQARAYLAQGGRGVLVQPEGGDPQAHGLWRALADPGSTRHGYDAMGKGDFAQVLSSSMVGASIAPRLQSAAADRAGARRAQPEVRLQDVLVSREYFRALTSSVDEVLRAAAFFERLAPASLTSGSRATVHSKQRPIGAPTDRAMRLSASLGDVAQVVKRLTEGRDPASISLRASELAATVADLIRASYDLPERLKGGVHAGYAGWGEDSVFVAGSSDSAARGLWGEPTLAEDRVASAAAAPGASPRALEQVIARAIREAKSREITNVQQLVASAARQQQLAPRRHFELFSPEKTLAMIAPQLESGGLLDPQSRQELAAAVKALAADKALTSAPRRVRTAFGTLSVRVVDGRLVVEAEEASSNAPGVGFESELLGRLAPTNAPTRQLHQLAHLNAPKPVFDGKLERGFSARQFSPGALAGQVEAQASRGASTAAGTAVSRGIEVALGRLSRAERIAGVELDPVRVRPEAEAAETRLRLGRAQVAERATLMRGGAAGDLIAVVAQSRRSAQLTGAMARSGLALPWQALVEGLSEGDAGALATLAAAGITPSALAAGERSVLAKLQQAGLDHNAIARLRSVAGTSLPLAQWLGSELIEPKSVARAIARLAEKKERFAARSRAAFDLADWGREDSVQLGAAHKELELRALGGLLTQAENRRSVGSLGQVGMARAAEGYFDRADMAYILPFMQRQARGWDRVVGDGTLDAAATAPSAKRNLADQLVPTLASLDPGTVLELGLSAGRGGDLLGVARKLGLSDHVISVLEAGNAAGVSLARIIGLDSSPRGFLASSALADSSPERALVAGGGRPSGDSWAAVRLHALDRAVEEASASQGTKTHAKRREVGDAARRATPSALRGSIFQKLAQVDGALAEFTLQRATIGRRFVGPGASALFHSSIGLPGDFVSVGGRRKDGSAWGGATLETAADVPTADRLRAVEAAVLRGEEDRVSRVGVTGIWMPSGVEKLTGATADIMTRPGHRLDGTLVAPKMFSATHSGGAWGEIKSPGAPETPSLPRLRLRATDLQRIAHSMALGLETFFSATDSRLGGTYQAGGKGDMVSMGVGKQIFSRGRWMSSTSSQEGAAALMEYLGIDHEGTLPSRQQVLPLHQGTLVQLPSSAPPAASEFSSAPQQVRAEKPKKRTSAPVTSVPTRQTPGYGSSDFGTGRDLFNPFMAAGMGASGVSALASKGGSSGQVETAQTENRGKDAHQSGTPPLEAIEDTAIEIYEILQRRWALEMERRGVE